GTRSKGDKYPNSTIQSGQQQESLLGDAANAAGDFRPDKSLSGQARRHRKIAIHTTHSTGGGKEFTQQSVGQRMASTVTNI
ncbi:hypothetical protein TW82_20880, partial [Pseudoalteromonas fuliginea]